MEKSSTNQKKDASKKSKPQELHVKDGHIRKRKKFTLKSDAFLVHGVQKFGLGKWKQIFEFYNFPPHRTPTHLKDRWRTVIKNGIVAQKLDKYYIVDNDLKQKFNKIDVKKENFNLEEPTEENECSMGDTIVDLREKDKEDEGERTEEEKLELDNNLKQKLNKIDVKKENFNLEEPTEDTECSIGDTVVDLGGKNEEDKDERTEEGELKEIFSENETIDENSNTADFFDFGGDDVFSFNSPGNLQTSSPKTTNLFTPTRAKPQFDNHNKFNHIVRSLEESLVQQTSESENVISPGQIVDTLEFNSPCTNQTATSQLLTKTVKRKRSIKSIQCKQEVEVYNDKEVNKPPSQKWEEWEVENLKKGIDEYGTSDWGRILNNVQLNNRTRRSIQSKYKRIKKNDSN